MSQSIFGHGDVAPLVSGIVNNALFHSSPHINPTLHQIIHILHFCLINVLLNYASGFAVNWIEVRAVRRPQIWKFRNSTMISEIIALGEWRQRMLHRLFG